MRLIPTLLLLTLTLASCGRSASFTPGPSYPEHLTRLEPSNIQVFKNARSVELTNTTARRYGRSRIWLNQWYSREIDGLDVGESVSLPLKSFTDEFGDEFRGGGFFAAEAPDKLVLAELETDVEARGEMSAGRVLLPLIVVGQREQ